jgi:hypothetical protein
MNEKLLTDTHVTLKNGDPVRFSVSDYGLVYSYCFHGYVSHTGFRSFFAYKQELLEGESLVQLGIRIAELLNADLHKVAKASKHNLDYLRKFALTEPTTKDVFLDYVVIKLALGQYDEF